MLDEEIAVARAEQGYRAKAGTCRDCAHLRWDETQSRGTRSWNQYEMLVSRTNYRCGLAEFPVALTGTCRSHTPKDRP